MDGAVSMPPAAALTADHRALDGLLLEVRAALRQGDGNEAGTVLDPEFQLGGEVHPESLPNRKSEDRPMGPRVRERGRPDPGDQAHILQARVA